MAEPLSPATERFSVAAEVPVRAEVAEGLVECEHPVSGKQDHAGQFAGEAATDEDSVRNARRQPL